MKTKKREAGSDEADHPGNQSAIEDANSAGHAAKLSLKHDKALNKGLPDTSKTSQTS
jgi:hypothetical protein